ncbi:MAG: cation diffusion facilitator family transporter [Gammaproteobacteria bacterium]
MITSANQASRTKLLHRVTFAAVAVAMTLIIIKLLAYYMTDAVSLLSSLIDSSMDMFASLINLLAVRKALSPADDDHRFGHGKAEPLAGLGQAAFITGSSVFLCFEAVRRLLQPVPIKQETIGIVVMIISLTLTIGLVLYQRRVIRETDSLAVRADSIHYLSDIILNLGVIAALVLTVSFGWTHADPLIAIAIALFILYSVIQIAKQSLDQLMDKELPDADRNRVMSIVTAHPQVRDVHDLRTRASGQNSFIQMHVAVDGGLSLKEAHGIAVAVQQQLESAFPEADIIIHQDPD